MSTSILAAPTIIDHATGSVPHAHLLIMSVQDTHECVVKSILVATLDAMPAEIWYSTAMLFGAPRELAGKIMAPYCAQPFARREQGS